MASPAIVQPMASPSRTDSRALKFRQVHALKVHPPPKMIIEAQDSHFFDCAK